VEVVAAEVLIVVETFPAVEVLVGDVLPEVVTFLAIEDLAGEVLFLGGGFFECLLGDINHR
jgi:hypothetical protein